MSHQPLDQLYDAAQTFAQSGGFETAHSGHLLWALTDQRTSAAALLEQRGLQRSTLESLLREPPPSPEPATTLDKLRTRISRNTAGTKLDKASLYLLMALSSDRNGQARHILTQSGIEPDRLRSITMALLTGNRPLPQAAPEPAAAVVETAQPARSSELARDPRRPAQRRPTPGVDPRITRASPRHRRKQPRLSKGIYPLLTSLGRNLSEEAVNGDLAPVVGRETELEAIVDILGKRHANNPCLIGEPGVGKTAIVEGLAYLQHHDPDRVAHLAERAIISVNASRLIAGTQLRGALAERLSKLRQEIRAAEGQIILFVDDIHALFGVAANADGNLDAASELGEAMGQGELPCIGATTNEHFRQLLERNPTLKRRLEPVLVAEPSTDQATAILQDIASSLANHHGIQFDQAALRAAARLSQRYVPDRHLPDKAIGLIDLAGSRARRHNQDTVGPEDIARIVSQSTEIPVERLLMRDTERLLKMEEFFARHLIGHQPIVRRLCDVVRRNYAGFTNERPIGSFLLLGPTGVGKTELVKVLADFLFQNPAALCRFDMSEFMEPHNVSRLIGSPPGYVGHDHGGQLTESVRKRPYQVILLDEIEKAHPDVMQLLLQILDEGRLTDGRGRTVDFSNTVVVMTSNLGSAHLAKRSSFGFGAAEDHSWQTAQHAVLSTAKRAFPIELWNRIEERLVFEPLDREEVREVAKMLIQRSSDRLYTQRRLTFDATDEVISLLLARGGYDPELGARPMRATIQRELETPISERILRDPLPEGAHLHLIVQEGEIAITVTMPNDGRSNALRQLPLV